MQKVHLDNLNKTKIEQSEKSIEKIPITLSLFMNKNSNLIQLAFRSEVKEKPGYFFFDLTLVGNLALVHFTRPDLSQSVCLNMHLAAAHLYRDK